MSKMQGVECMAKTIAVPEYETSPAVEVSPRDTALIIVDMQNDFVDPEGSLHVPDAVPTVTVIKELLQRARVEQMPIFYTQDTHSEQDPEFDIWGPHARENTWGWEIIDELQPRPNERIIQKLRYDGFYGTSLDHELRLGGIRRLIICGTVANICVHYTAASAALRWYEVIIPKDAVSALDPFDLEASLRQTAFLFKGQITHASGIQITRP